MPMKVTARFEEAFAYAAHVHAAQTRKGSTIPYISHLLAVTSIALEHGATEDEAISALLHDTAEDHGGEARLEDIGARFGPNVERIVAECSDTFETPKPDWRPRKERYVALVPGVSSSGRLVSAADKLHNARAILADYRRVGERLWTRFSALSGRNDILWYYDALIDAYRQAGDHASLVDELGAVIQDLRREIEGSRGARTPNREAG